MCRLLLLTFTGLFIISCNQPIQVDRAELKEIYSTILAADSLTEKHCLIDSIENFDKRTITQSDTTYHIASCNDVKNGIWTNNLSDSLILISTNKLDSLSQPDPFTKTPIHYRFSLPYYAKDKQSLLIYYDYYCGNLCAESSLRLYRKMNGKWTYVKSYFTIVS